MTAIGAEYGVLRHAAGMVDRSDRGFVSVAGLDALTFLQSIVSADVAGLADGQGVHSLLLHPQGKLDVDFRLLRVGEECWLDADPGMGTPLAASLARFRIRVKVDIGERSGGMLSVRGPATDELFPEASVEQHEHVGWHGARLVRADWPGSMGVDVVGPLDAIRAARVEIAARGVTECSPGALELVRIEAGVPRHGFELDDTVIPQEAFLERDAVSFTKGCFLGQELVCRIDTRGHVNRYLRCLRVQGDELPPRGAEISAAEKIVGSITSVARSPELGVVALGYVRREIEPPADVELRWDGAVAPARVTITPERAHRDARPGG